VSDDLPDLRSYIDHVIDSGVTDVADIAVKVRHSAPAEVLEAHMLYLLRLAVRQRRAERTAQDAILLGSTAKVRRNDAPLSVKRQRQRDQWAADRERWLNNAFSVGGRQVSMRDATVADLLAAAAHRRTQAAELAARAERFEEIAALPEMQREGMTVGKLPDAVLRRLAERP
jgi:hypothetical protein